MSAGRVRRLAAGAGLAAVLALGGCATAPPGGQQPAAPGPAAAAAAKNPVDPWEAWNRRVFGFNDALDRAIVQPAAEAYVKVVPGIVRTGVSNALGNVGDAWSTLNHALQGKFATALEMGMRVAWNTVFGLAGTLDMATEMGLPRRSEDFGQTLGTWGFRSGPYLVLPLFGPSSVRDSFGFAVDRVSADVARFADTDATRAALATLEVIDARAALLSTTSLIGDVALDRYSFVRDAWLARRADQLRDGAPALDEFSDPGDDPVESSAGKPAAPRPTPAAPRP